MLLLAEHSREASVLLLITLRLPHLRVNEHDPTVRGRAITRREPFMTQLVDTNDASLLAKGS